MKKIKEVIVVEGKTDTAIIKKLFDADTIETHGLGIDEKTLDFIEQAQKTRGVIILTDPDYPGMRIRNTIMKRVPEAKHAFVNKEDAIGEKKVGIAEAKEEAIIKALENVVSFSHEDESISWNEFISLDIIGNKKRRLKVYDTFHLGYGNVKTLFKRLNLAHITKKDIIKYNTINNIKYFTDNTNEDTSYTRNRIRKNILPLLKKENPNVHKSFLKYSNTIQEYYNYIEDYTKKIIKEKYNSHTINIEEFKKEHLFIQKNIIYYILSEIYQNKDNIIKESHVTSIINLINNNKPNISLNLPHNYQAKKIYKTLNIDKINTNSSTKEYLIQVENKPINIDKIEIKKIDNTLEDGNNICRLNSKNISMPIYIRNKRSGDYIEVLGLNGKKKISDIFIEKKIPKDIRDTYPLLVDSNNNVLWIPNIKKSKYNVKKNELCDIILTSYEKGGNEIEEKRK